MTDEGKWKITYQTLKDRLDPGGEVDNNVKTMNVDGIVLAAGAWCEYLGSLVDVHIPVCNISIWHPWVFMYIIRIICLVSRLITFYTFAKIIS